MLSQKQIIYSHILFIATPIHSNIRLNMLLEQFQFYLLEYNIGNPIKTDIIYIYISLEGTEKKNKPGSFSKVWGI